jgi:hypothetical protein
VPRSTAVVCLGIALGAMLGLAGCGSGSGSTPPPPPMPSITSLSPASSAVGAAVTITGTNFGAPQGTSTVTFNGIPATPTSWSATSIVVPVPAGATTGNVVVTVSGVASAGAAFTVLPTPSIASVLPASAAAGTSVTITGTNFGATQGTSTVTFNGVTATPTSWSATSIVVPVPAAATTGNVVVTVNGVASAGAAFTVVPTPNIGSLLPPSAAVGAPVTITGANFGATRGSSTLTFNGVTATPTSWSATSIVAPVPAGPTTGSVVVTVNGIASAGVAFTAVPLSIAPRAAAVVVTTQTQQFTAWVTSNASVNWSVDGLANGNTTVGTISTNGLYTPPSTAGTHVVTATSVANPADTASANVAVTDLAGVLTYHNDLLRDGADVQEYGLTASTVNTNTFGKLFSCPVDGAVYTQPLWVPGVSISGGIHNVILVATQHDSMYAFDADASPCVQLWQVNLLDTLHGGAAGETPVVWNDVGNVGAGCYGDIYPEVGVTGTPVIDPTTGTIYVVSASEIPSGSSGNCQLPPATFYHRLHALDITTGSEKPQSPMTIAAQVAGTGDGSSGGMVSFNSQLHHQRSGLALSNGAVYVAFAAHEDQTPYHGWLLGYNASNVQLQVSVFNTTPNGIGGADGGIWAGGGAPAVDSTGDIYVSTGNGVFDQGTGMSLENDYGDSVLRLTPAAGPTPNGSNLKLDSWFTPFDEFTLEQNDTDLGSGGVILLPDQTVGPPHLLVELGKDGVVYLIDRDNMGQFQPNTNSQIPQYFGATSAFWGTAAFWQNNLYFAGAGDVLKQFSFDPTAGLFCSPQPCTPSPATQSSQAYGFPDVSPSVSSQGSSNGMVWAIDAGLYGYASPNAAGGVFCYQVPVPAACTGPAILHAYDATNLPTEYWNSTQAADNRDQAGNAVKFVPPTIANGKVYVSTRTEIDVYGLLP